MNNDDGLKMKYFILKPGGDDAYAIASRKAMLAYAESIHSTNPVLAYDLKEWLKFEQSPREP